MNKVLGLDIGITSVGWSVIDHDSGDILDCGVRLFEEGTASKNVDRRTKRSGRRLKRRRHNRIEDAKKILKRAGLISGNFESLEHPYDLRIKGLTEKLTDAELATAILHLVKRRGSSLEVVEDDESKEKENQKSKSVLSNNEALMRSGLYPCQIQKDRLMKDGSLRGEQNNFKTTSYIAELREILKHQAVKDEFIEEVVKVVSRKRAYYEGPGSETSPTPYGRFVENENGEIIVVDLIEKMRGKCSVFPTELRAPKMAPSADLFNFLNDLNNLTIIGEDGDEKISTEQKHEIVDKLIVGGKHKVTPKELAKYLECEIDYVKGFRINKSEEYILTEFKGLQLIAKALIDEPNLSIILSDFKLMDSIIDVLTRTKTIDERLRDLSILSSKLDKNQIEKLAHVSGITGYHALSMKAIDVLLPDLYDTNDNQMQILSRKNLLSHQKHQFKGLGNIPLDAVEILSPVAKRAQRETFKVINAVRKQYGELDAIVVEMPRDKNTDEQKSRIKQEQKKYESEKSNVLAAMQGKNANAKSILKARLYLQQDGKSLYSGTPIDLDMMLNDPTAYEVDHIIPISISFDDSMSNKVLVSRKDNQIKGNRTPYMVFQAEGFGGWSYPEYYSFCFNLMKNQRDKSFNKKFQYLVFDEDITKFDVLKQFINRNLVDTRYASRSVLNTLQSYFSANSIPTKIISVRGAVTSAFRKRLFLEKDREENFYHHAVDATIVAMLTSKQTIYDIFRHSKVANDKVEVDDFKFRVEDEDEYFSEAFMRLLSKVKYVGVEPTETMHASHFMTPKLSFKVDRKPNRQISDETIYGTRSFEGEELVSKKYKDIYDPKFLTLAEIIDGKKGKPDDLLIYRNDRKSYDKLVEVVEEYKRIVGPIEKENPFYWYKEIQKNGHITKYAKDGNGAPIISIRYLDGRLGNHIDITKNYQSKGRKVVLLQISPYRTDIYKNDKGEYKFITLRYNDVFYSDDNGKFKINEENYRKKLVEKGIDDTFKFQFKLNRNDVFEITAKQKNEENKSFVWRMVATNNDTTNSIEVRPLHRHKYFNQEKKKEEVQKFITIGRSTKQIRKLNVDILGNQHEVKNEALTFILE